MTTALQEIQMRIEAALKRAGRISDQVRVLAISKGQTADAMQPLYAQGVRQFGENRIPEALEKKLLLPADVEWHFIGTLQTNKVRKAVGQFALIHSVDSLHLAQKIDQVSFELGVVTKVLLQVNCSKEASKHGLSEKELLLQFPQFLALKNISVLGLMTMAANTKEASKVRDSFSMLRELREKLRTKYPECSSYFCELSMGMSQDFEIAIEEGATIVRIGSLLFTP